MTRILYIDPFGGVAGDMLFGALLDLGVDRSRLAAALDGLHLPGWCLEAGRDRQQGFAGTRVAVRVDAETHPARHLADVERLLGAADLPARARKWALASFRTLFAAESEVHGVPVDETHLHELAAVDAVVDIVGVCSALDLLGVDRVVCGPVPVGTGTVTTRHGLLPVPAPAVARLLRGVPIAAHAANGEMTTPTGATLLGTLVDEFGPHPAGRITAIGVGLGRRKFEGLPNILRVFLVESEAVGLPGRPMVLVETTLDDVPGEVLGYLTERLRAAGAVDAWCMAGTGRKGRPINELRALVEPAQAPAVAAVLFSEGVTLGVRLVPCTRPELVRQMIEVATPYGPIPVKVGFFAGRVVSVKPEHDACAAAASAAGVGLVVVVEEARAAAPRAGEAMETVPQAT